MPVAKLGVTRKTPPGGIHTELLRFYKLNFPITHGTFQLMHRIREIRLGALYVPRWSRKSTTIRDRSRIVRARMAIGALHALFKIFPDSNYKKCYMSIPRVLSIVNLRVSCRLKLCQRETARGRQQVPSCPLIATNLWPTEAPPIAINLKVCTKLWQLQRTRWNEPHGEKRTPGIIQDLSCQ